MVTWNALRLNGLGHVHNDSRSAILCFEELLGQGGELDATTFVCLLLASSHEGLVDEGKPCNLRAIWRRSMAPRPLCTVTLAWWI